MADAVVSFVVDTFGELLVDEAKFLCGVGGQVVNAQTQLNQLLSSLKDADSYAGQRSETFRNSVAEIREAVLDLEDVIATFFLTVAYRRGRGFKSVAKRFACIIREGIELHQIGSAIQDICLRVSIIRTGDGAGAGAGAGPSTSNEIEMQRKLRWTFCPTDEDDDHDFVGFADDINKLVEVLTEEENSHKVVSIFGMGGLGKTTLARKVYHNNGVRQHFDSFAWVSISHREERDILETILISLTSPTAKIEKEIKEMKDELLVNKLFRVQKEMKCLVILDDIWKIETWSCLKRAFPTSESKSKILLTTRIEQVAQEGFAHELGFLTDEESWELFEKKTSLQRHLMNAEDYEIMEPLGREMLKHCAGLPLAIIVLSGLLKPKEIVQWQMVHADVQLYITKGGYHDKNNSGASWVLGLSYDELPYHLRACFMHLAHFPKDCEIRVKELCRIWTAEGFALLSQHNRRSKKTVEDASYECLQELVKRCMVQVVQRGSTGRIKTCRLHDVMREFCLSKAEDENFVKYIEFKDKGEGNDFPFIGSGANIEGVGKVRRLALNVSDNADKLLLSTNNSKYEHVRSLLCFNPLATSCGQVLKPLFNCFLMLRVLKFGIIGVLKFPKEIEKLIHLRFLSLKDGNVEQLPSSIGNLRCLQTLDLQIRMRENIELVFPNVIWRLKHLRHLYLPSKYSVTGNKLRLSNLDNLQTLVNVSMENVELNDLEQLTKLRKLRVGVHTNLGEKFKPEDIKLRGLRSLAVVNLFGTTTDVEPIILSCPEIHKLCLSGKISKLPRHDQFSSDLVKLTLNGSLLEEDPMTELEKLSKLKILRLQSRAFEGQRMVCSKGGFPKLQILSLIQLFNLEELKLEEGALPILYRLEIENCFALSPIPDGLKYITTLKELKIEEKTWDFKKKIEEREDFYEVLRVPVLGLLN